MAILLLVGGALIALTVLIHAAGATALVQLLLDRYADENGALRRGRAMPAIAITTISLLLLHWVEILIWAAAYLLLDPVAPITTVESAVYFSAVTFTTLGYGDITLGTDQWRILSGLEALNGVLLLGLSTALQFAVVQRSWQLHSRG